MRRLLFLLFLLVAAPALAQTYPKLSGRVVDSADLLTPAEESALSQKLEALEQASSRQLVVATVPDLQGYPIEDYGYKLGRAWGIGQKGTNNGAILLVAKNDRKVRIEAGYGLEPILTDAFSSQVIQDKIVPAFKNNDYPGGINAGVDAIIAQLQAPPDRAEAAAVAAADRRKGQAHRGSSSPMPLIFWGVIMLFVIVPMIRRGGRGRRFGSAWPIMIWGPGMGGNWGGGGSSGGSGFGGFGGGGGGGFSGGGGSFGGGGASGGW